MCLYLPKILIFVLLQFSFNNKFIIIYILWKYIICIKMLPHLEFDFLTNDIDSNTRA